MNMSRVSMWLVWLTVIAFIITLVPPSMPAIIPENGPPVKGDGGNVQNNDGKQNDSSKVVDHQGSKEPVEDSPLMLYLKIVAIAVLAILVIVLSIMIAVFLLGMIDSCYKLFDCPRCGANSNSIDKQHHKGHKADKKKAIPKGTGKVYHNNTASTAKPAVTGESKTEAASKRSKSRPISGGQTGGGNGGNSCTDLSATANHYTSPADGTTSTNTSDGQKPKVKALVDHHNQQNK